MYDLQCPQETVVYVFNVAFSPDGSRLAWGGSDHLVRVMDVAAVPEPVSPRAAATAAQLAADVLRGAVPPGVLADFLEENGYDLTGHQAAQLRWGNLYPAGFWAEHALRT